MVWRLEDPQGNESGKVKYEVVPYTRGRGLDLGCGMFKLYPHFIGVDNRKQYGSKLSPADEYALRISVDIEADCENLEMFTSNSMDFVFSSHLLEHIKNSLRALKEWWRTIKPGGHLVLYLPHKNFYPNIGEEGSNPDHKHDFLPRDVIEMMKSVGGWDLVVSEERNQDNEYSFLQIYKKLPKSNNEQFFSCSPNTAKPRKTCCIVRYGGFGDMVQCSSIFPALKAQGYHITVMTTPRGHNIIKQDPYVDNFIIQDTDQVPNEELRTYWGCWEKKFDRFINLSESVEGTFLLLPTRPQYYWPKSARHELLNRNYLEFTHILAGVPFKPAPWFYPTEAEVNKAVKTRRKISGKVILWVLDGSSVHKHWPWMDNAFARVLLHTDFKIVTVGNEISKLLEAGWENEPRIITKSGKWTIRETMAFAQQCDIIVGPETGILNAVGIMDMPKIMFLSHSSPENISKHFLNCTAIKPDDCYCWPCHRMHFGWEFCNRQTAEFKIGDQVAEIEGALCQMNISIDKFWEALMLHVRKMGKAA